MNWVIVSSILLSFIQWTVIIVTGANSSDPYTHSAWLDSKYQYNLRWHVDWTQRQVIFNVTASTVGYVEFGIAKGLGRTGMASADIVRGGVRSDGSVYFSNRYEIGNQLGVKDPPGLQNWNLLTCYENGTHTFLSFSRPIDACDENYAIRISDNLSIVIWAFGEKDDELMYQNQTRGTFPIYLLDPDFSPDLEEFNKLEQIGTRMNMTRFVMRANYQLQAFDAMYWCHFFKTPTSTKHHIIGFGVQFPSHDDRVLVPDLQVYRCRAPTGGDSKILFDSAARSAGSECFFPSDPSNDLQTLHCQEVIYAWGSGGKDIFFPENAGLSMSTNGSEYFMVRVHYDNIIRAEKNVSLIVNTYYTRNIRQNEIGMISLGHISPASTSIVIPPNSLRHIVNGYCSEQCLGKLIPSDGVKVFAAFSHTHLLGTGVRFLHLRDDVELPWISNEDNYQFGHQQFRVHKNERTVKPNDQLGIRCSYDTTSRNGTAVVGGFSQRHEMCKGYLYYYSNQSAQFISCRSQLKSDEYMNLLGIMNTTWDPFRLETIVTQPAEYAGLTVYDYVNEHIDWDLAMKQEVQRLQLYEPQETLCPVINHRLSTWENSNGDWVTSWNPSLWGVKRYRKLELCNKDKVGPDAPEKILQRVNVRIVEGNTNPHIKMSPITSTSAKPRQLEPPTLNSKKETLGKRLGLRSGFWKDPRQQTVNSITV